MSNRKFQQERAKVYHASDDDLRQQIEILTKEKQSLSQQVNDLETKLSEAKFDTETQRLNEEIRLGGAAMAVQQREDARRERDEANEKLNTLLSDIEAHSSRIFRTRQEGQEKYRVAWSALIDRVEALGGVNPLVHNYIYTIQELGVIQDELIAINGEAEDALSPTNALDTPMELIAMMLAQGAAIPLYDGLRHLAEQALRAMDDHRLNPYLAAQEILEEYELGGDVETLKAALKKLPDTWLRALQSHPANAETVASGLIDLREGRVKKDNATVRRARSWVKDLKGWSTVYAVRKQRQANE